MTKIPLIISHASSRHPCNYSEKPERFGQKIKTATLTISLHYPSLFYISLTSSTPLLSGGEKSDPVTWRGARRSPRSHSGERRRRIPSSRGSWTFVRLWIWWKLLEASGMYGVSPPRGTADEGEAEPRVYEVWKGSNVSLVISLCWLNNWGVYYYFFNFYFLTWCDVLGFLICLVGFGMKFCLFKFKYKKKDCKFGQKTRSASLMYLRLEKGRVLSRFLLQMKWISVCCWGVHIAPPWTLSCSQDDVSFFGLLAQHRKCYDKPQE